MVNFFLVAAVIFFALRAVVAAEKKMHMLPDVEEEQERETILEPSDEAKLLTEIRDLIRESKA